MAHSRPGRRTWPAIFLACLLLAGLRSLHLGKDANWDLKNYHWYNAWALLNDRIAYDVAPAQLQGFHNPLGEMPFYALVQAFDEPRIVAFLMAAPAGIAAYFLLRLLVLLFPFDRSRANGLLWVGAAAAIGMTGAGGAAAWGATMNEWPSAALVLAALWLVVRALVERGGAQLPAFAAAGLLVGCAVGLKLTYGIYGFGFAAACLACGTPRERAARTLTAGACMGAGFLACYAWWGAILWQSFENPFFPYFNAVFRSPWWEPVSFFDPNFGPRDWKQWLFFPLYFARRHLLVGEVQFRDYRLATLLVLALAAWAASRLRNLRARPHAPATMPAPGAQAWRLLAVFTLVSYVAWLKIFGIYRYLVVHEALAGPLIVACVLYLVRSARARVVVVAVLAGLLVGTTRMGGWGRIPFGERYFEVSAPPLPPESLVIVGHYHPMAYLVPFFRPDARFVSPSNNLIQVGQRNLLAARAESLIRGHRGPAYLLEQRVRLPNEDRTLAHFGLARSGECIAVPSTFDADQLRLCPVAPVRAP